MITNKRMLEYYKQWLISNKRNLYDCYKKPSQSKITSLNYILHICYDIDDGYDLKIISYNKQHYTIGYVYDIIDYYAKERITYFTVITKMNIQKIIVKREAL